jgi:hypothetical protein
MGVPFRCLSQRGRKTSSAGEVITDGWITTHVKATFVGEDL